MSFFPLTPQSLGAFHSLVAPSSLPYDHDDLQLPPHFRHFDQLDDDNHHDRDHDHDDPAASPSPYVVDTMVDDNSDDDSESDFLRQNSDHLRHSDNLPAVNAPGSLHHVSASIKPTSLSVSATHFPEPTVAAAATATARRVHSMPLLQSQLTSSPTSWSSASATATAVRDSKFGYAVSAPISIPTSSVNYHAYSPSCRAAANVYAVASSSDKSLTPPRPFIHRRDRDIPYACRRSNYHTSSFVEQKDRFMLDGAVDTYHHDQLENEEKSVELDDDEQGEEIQSSWCNSMDGLFVCEEDIVPSTSFFNRDEYVVSSSFAKKQQLSQAANQRLQMFPL